MSGQACQVPGGVRAGQAAHGGAHPLQALRVGKKISNGGQEPVGQGLILDQQGCAALDQVAGVHLLVAPGIRVGDQDGGQSEQGVLTQDRGAGAGDRQVGGSQGRAHIMQVRHGMVAAGNFGRQGGGCGLDLGPIQAAGEVQHLGVRRQAREDGQQGPVERAGALAPASDQQDLPVGGQPQGLAGGGLIQAVQVGPGGVARNGQGCAGAEIEAGSLRRSGRSGRRSGPEP